jgi:hypothetical protein
VVPAHLLHERVQVRLVGGDPLPPLRVLLQRDRDEGDEAVNGDHRAQHVEQLGGRGAGVQQGPVGVGVERDGAQHRTVRRGHRPGPHTVDHPAAHRLRR